MNRKEAKRIDRALRNFERKHPIKHTTKPSLEMFIDNIEKQLDKL